MSNFIKEKLKSGGTAFGTMVFECDSPGIPAILHNAGLEFVIYDMEHSGFGIETIRKLMSYNRGLNLMPFVRVPDSQYFHIANVLDVGAMGIMVPMVETREQIQRVIQAAKYYPIGKRGTAFGIAHDNFSSREPVSITMQRANEDIVVIALIETQAGLDHLEDIVSVDGLDIAWVGHSDLAQSLGIPGQVNHPQIISSLHKVAEACDKYGKTAGRLVPDVQSAVHWIKNGYRCISYSGDIWLLQDAIASALSDIQNQL